MLSVVSKNFDAMKQKKVARHCYIDLVCSSVETQHNRAHVLPISNSFRKSGVERVERRYVTIIARIIVATSGANWN